MGTSDPLAIAARLTGDTPLVSLGDAGTLLEIWHDRESIDLLRLIAGMPHPDPSNGAAGRFGWVRDQALPDTLLLGDSILGVRISAATPELLADGIEYLAATVNRLLAAIAEENQACDGEGVETAADLTLRLRPLLAVTPADAPPGVALALDEAPLLVAGAPPGGDIDRLRHDLHEPELQDHRAIIPPKKRR